MEKFQKDASPNQLGMTETNHQINHQIRKQSKQGDGKKWEKWDEFQQTNIKLNEKNHMINERKVMINKKNSVLR